MKKIIKKTFIVFIFFITICPVFSLTVNPFSFNGVTFKMGNDRWTHGISYNYDDLLTYSLGLDLDFSTFKIESDMLAFTDKYEKTRYDLFNINLVVPLKFSDYLTVSAKAGVSFYGNLGLQAIQNSFHKIIKIYQLDLQYFNHKTFVDFGLDMNSNIPVAFLEIGPYFKFDYKTKFGSEAEIGLNVKLDTLTMFLNYKFYDRFIDDITYIDWISNTKGLNVGFKINKGTFDLDFFVNTRTKNRIGYTTIKVSLFKPYIKGIFKYSFGKIWYVAKNHEKDKTVLEDFNTVGIDYKHFFLLLDYNTGSNIKNVVAMDNLVLSLGYDVELFKNFSLKPSFKFARYTPHSNFNSEYFYGGSLDIQYGFDIFDNYKINFFLGFTYLPNLLTSPSFGFNISLI